MTISGIYGFGQPITSLEMDLAVKAVYYEMIGQTFAVLGMAIPASHCCQAVASDFHLGFHG
jgi:hypothetical protein